MTFQIYKCRSQTLRPVLPSVGLISRCVEEGEIILKEYLLNVYLLQLRYNELKIVLVAFQS